MSLKAVVKFLDYRFKQIEEDVLYKSITAEYMATIGVGKTNTERISFVEGRNKIYGIKVQKDERSAEEIIRDTFKKHGIKIKGKEEAIV